MGLWFLGSRRPETLAEVDEYAENVSRPAAEPVEHREGRAAGRFVGRGSERRTNRAADRPGKHRA